VRFHCSQTPVQSEHSDRCLSTAVSAFADSTSPLFFIQRSKNKSEIHYDARLTANGARFADGTEQAFDDVILATGYTAEMALLGNLVQRDACGFARRRNRVVSVDQPDLFFVGHNYDVRGGLFNIARDARLAAGQISAALRDTRRTSTGTPRPPRER